MESVPVLITLLCTLIAVTIGKSSNQLNWYPLHYVIFFAALLLNFASGLFFDNIKAFRPAGCNQLILKDISISYFSIVIFQNHTQRISLFLSIPSWELPDFHPNLAFVWRLQLIKSGKCFIRRLPLSQIFQRQIALYLPCRSVGLLVGFTINVPSPNNFLLFLLLRKNIYFPCPNISFFVFLFLDKKYIFILQILSSFPSPFFFSITKGSEHQKRDLYWV